MIPRSCAFSSSLLITSISSVSRYALLISILNDPTTDMSSSITMLFPWYDTPPSYSKRVTPVSSILSLFFSRSAAPKLLPLFATELVITVTSFPAAASFIVSYIISLQIMYGVCSFTDSLALPIRLISLCHTTGSFTPAFTGFESRAMLST